MSMSNNDISTLRDAINQYQAAVRKRDEEERLQHEATMETIGIFFKSLVVVGIISLIVINWEVIWETIKFIFGLVFLILLIIGVIIGGVIEAINQNK